MPNVSADNRTLSSPVRGGGFTLIEVLVAMLILLVGLLGVAKLQLTSFQGSRNAFYRMHATVIAEDLLDRVRSNPQGLASGGYNGVEFNSQGGTPTNVACIDTAGCTPAQIATLHRYEWARNFVAGHPQFSASLPGARGEGDIDAVDPTNNCGTRLKYDVAVSWTDVDGEQTVELSICVVI